MIVEHHLAARRRRRVEPVHGAVAGVAQVMIDVDDAVALETGDAGPRQVAALQHEAGVVVALGARGDLDEIDARECREGDRRRIGVDDAHRLAERAKREGHRHLRADRIAVGTRVRGEQEPRPRSTSSRIAASSGRSVGRGVATGWTVIGIRGASSEGVGGSGSPGAAARRARRERWTRRTGTRASGARRSRRRAASWRRRNGVARSRPRPVRRLSSSSPSVV